MSPQDEPRPAFTAQVTGVIKWSCPACGYVTATQLRPMTWRIRCGSGDCQRWIVLGYIGYTVGHLARALGRGSIPVPPDVAMPMRTGVVTPLTIGAPIHRTAELVP